MSEVKCRAMTVADYRLMPETGPRYQLVQGRFYMSPAPNRFHQQIVGNIFYLFKRYLDDNPIGDAYVAPFDVYLTDIDAYQPDVIFVSNANRGILTDQGAEGPPDWRWKCCRLRRHFWIWEASGTCTRGLAFRSFGSLIHKR